MIDTAIAGTVDQRRDLAASLEAVLFTLNRPVTVLELRDIRWIAEKDVSS